MITSKHEIGENMSQVTLNAFNKSMGANYQDQLWKKRIQRIFFLHECKYNMDFF